MVDQDKAAWIDPPQWIFTPPLNTSNGLKWHLNLAKSQIFFLLWMRHNTQIVLRHLKRTAAGLLAAPDAKITLPDLRSSLYIGLTLYVAPIIIAFGVITIFRVMGLWIPILDVLDLV